MLPTHSEWETILKRKVTVFQIEVVWVWFTYLDRFFSPRFPRVGETVSGHPDRQIAYVHIYDVGSGSGCQYC